MQGCLARLVLVAAVLLTGGARGALLRANLGRGLEGAGATDHMQMLLSVSQLQSLQDVKSAAKQVLTRFHEEELDPQFGAGLSMDDVESVRGDSEVCLPL